MAFKDTFEDEYVVDDAIKSVCVMLALQVSEEEAHSLLCAKGFSSHQAHFIIVAAKILRDRNV